MSNLNQFSAGLLKFNTTQRVNNPSSSSQSAAFQSDTVAIAIGSIADGSNMALIHFNIGSNPTANTAHPTMPFVGFNDGAASTGSGSYLIIGVEPGHKIACLRSAGYTVDAQIIELKY